MRYALCLLVLVGCGHSQAVATNPLPSPDQCVRQEPSPEFLKCRKIAAGAQFSGDITREECLEFIEIEERIISRRYEDCRREMREERELAIAELSASVESSRRNRTAVAAGVKALGDGLQSKPVMRCKPDGLRPGYTICQ